MRSPLSSAVRIPPKGEKTHNSRTQQFPLRTVDLP